MNLVQYAVPFFILAMLVELAWGVSRGRNTYRINDSVGSLSLGVLSQARRFVTLGIGGYVYHLVTEYFSLPLLDAGHWSTWLLALVLYDFCYYWLHRLGHERSILWAAHVAHHQSEEYNLSTALRQTSTGFLLGWVFYVPMYLLGIPAEVVVTAGAINLIYQFWVHTEHIPKLGWYEWVFVTPSNHRVHHAQNDIYMDRNYGGMFILWDRLFGTFQEELAEEPPVFGIRGPLRSFSPLRALTHIYADMARDSWYTRDWRDKLRVWVARTGWRPADVAAANPRPKPELAAFRKYDPAVAARVPLYALFQLVASIALLLWMQSAQLSYAAGFLGWCVLLATLSLAAAWLDGRPARWVLALEGVRLLASALLLVWGADAVSGALLAALAYLVLSAAWLVQLGRSSDCGSRLADAEPLST
ncbi:sterol desaturase family protein [Mangrovimicrobium sediminis]|uniref:Sterol desaturase family protein n=1 Tax=Mangrovimicrobium sediminis TaxID=2562682 RepID=A0A4Z0M8F1_9GAMM|nr:sterol desaturase family protein [Haliea sp. SAOS-164]TGD75680.1 sterol desaturase family protein [Haliea sp. SAOS-164]